MRSNEDSNSLVSLDRKRMTSDFSIEVDNTSEQTLRKKSKNEIRDYYLKKLLRN
jgi:hypothetical protein